MTIPPLAFHFTFNSIGVYPAGKFSHVHVIVVIPVQWVEQMRFSEPPDAVAGFLSDAFCGLLNPLLASALGRIIAGGACDVMFVSIASALFTVAAAPVNRSSADTTQGMVNDPLAINPNPTKATKTNRPRI
jgi:hypothetical protein